MRPLSAFALLALAGLGGTPACLAAQEPAALELTVIDAGSGEPLAGARIVLSDGRAVPSARDGTAVIRGLAAGAIRGEVTRMGYAARSFAIPLAPGATLSLSVPLEPAPVALPPLEVEASPYGVRSQSLRGFYERVETGRGFYLTRDEVEQRQAGRLVELLHGIPGLAFGDGLNGEEMRSMVQTSITHSFRSPVPREPCPIQFFVDGSPVDVVAGGLRSLGILPSEVEGVEVYLRTSQVPARFRRTNKTCGAIVIWKRERF